MAAVFVTGVGLAGVALSRVSMRHAETSSSAAESEILAVSAVECASLLIQQNPSWRTDYTNDTLSSKVPMGNGFIWFKIAEDPSADKDLKTADGPVRIYGYGECHGTKRIHSVELSETFPLPCLGVALHADKRIDIDSARIDASQPISANGRVTANFGDVRCDVESAIDISGGSYSGLTSAYVPARFVPSHSDVLSAWTDMATPIALARFPGVDATPGFARNVLAAGYNPFDDGNTNPMGVYHVDCLGGNFIIEDSRILGTLVLTNVMTVTVQGAVHWTPAVPNYPVLIVKGDVEFDYISNPPLKETTESVNFNPAGAPFKGKTDTSLNDDYDSVIDGLVYCSGDATFLSSRLDFHGCLLSGGQVTFDLGSDTQLFYDPIYAMQPPPGFTAGTRPMQIIPGSWRWETE